MAVDEQEKLWNPRPYAIAAEYEGDRPDEMPGSLVFRHPTVPFRRDLPDFRDDSLFNLSREYLDHIVDAPAGAIAHLDRIRDSHGRPIPEEVRTLFRGWVAALGQPFEQVSFSWVPFDDPEKSTRRPMASFKYGERTRVLIASERIGGADDDAIFLGSGFGLRVVVHLEGPAGSPTSVRITGFSASLPFGPYVAQGMSTIEPKAVGLEALSRFFEETAKEIQAALRLDKPVFTGLRLHRVPDNRSRVAFAARGTSFNVAPNIWGGPGDVQTDADYARVASVFHVSGTHRDDLQARDAPGEGLVINAFEKLPLVADADADADPAPVKEAGFPRDPASEGMQDALRKRRPTRGDEALKKFKKDADVTTPVGELSVLQAPLFAVPIHNLPPTSPFMQRSLRSNEFSRSSARVSLDRVLETLRRTGLEPKTWSRLTQLPLRAFYRSGIRPGPGKDGVSVNARVYLGTWRASFFEEMTAGDFPSVSVHLALSDIMYRSRQLPRPAEYMGIGADVRWVWHEFGHVLLAASVGELEFRFAHSPGDGLAAIACDPHSELVTEPLRGATFPWVSVPRRHDRCPSHGWSWSGSLHRSRSLCADPDRVRRRGYLSEQILSSSLFRLYRSLGGDTRAGDAAKALRTREIASDYTIYLVARAVGLLGYAGAVPAHTVEHLVAAMIEADIGTETLTIPPWPKDDTDADSTRLAAAPVRRVGGCAHKVVRWAFERQGLYGEAGGSHNGPGAPPPVDVYIADQRGEEHYGPTSLTWDVAGAAGWFGDRKALSTDTGGSLHVRVGNRGQLAAEQVTVTLWVRPYVGGDPPQWQGGRGWTTLGTSGAITIPPGNTVRVGPFTATEGLPESCLLLAAATCPEDRANTDKATHLPCSREPVGLVDLVSADNNLALWIVRPGA